MSYSSTSSVAMAQHPDDDEVDQLLRAVMPHAPEFLHHVLALEGMSL